MLPWKLLLHNEPDLYNKRDAMAMIYRLLSAWRFDFQSSPEDNAKALRIKTLECSYSILGGDTLAE